ncbi:MAG: hypothetical protein IJW81_06850, partial [Clostridia bacterium]|nr:hypothetical protein [Clostridia bacterium]
MKKILSGALTAALLTSLLTVAASAITTNEITIKGVEQLPTIDGKYDPAEGWGDPVADLGWDVMNDYISDDIWESDDEILPTAVTSYLRWDEEHLYFCSVVVDNIYYNDNVPEDLGMAYAGDALQFDIKSLADDDVANRNRIFYGLSNDGVICVNQDKVEAGASGELGANASWTECVITRDEATKTTTYETVFDLSKILPETMVGEGDQFYVRQIVLCTMDSGTEDIVDVNVPGMKEGTYAYWLLNLGGIPEGEVVAEEPAAEEAPAEEAVEEVVEEPVVEETPAEEAVEETVVEEVVEETVVEEA